MLVHKHLLDKQLYAIKTILKESYTSNKLAESRHFPEFEKITTEFLKETKNIVEDDDHYKHLMNELLIKEFHPLFDSECEKLFEQLNSIRNDFLTLNMELKQSIIKIGNKSNSTEIRNLLENIKKQLETIKSKSSIACEEVSKLIELAKKETNKLKNKRITLKKDKNEFEKFKHDLESW